MKESTVPSVPRDFRDYREIARTILLILWRASTRLLRRLWNEIVASEKKKRKVLIKGGRREIGSVSHRLASTCANHTHTYVRTVTYIKQNKKQDTAH